MLPALDPDTTRLVDSFAALSERIARLEAERDDVKQRLVDALGERRGTVASPRAAVRVLDRPTCRFEPTRVVAALDEARFLRDVAYVAPARLRRAMDENLALGRAVAPLVELETYTYVGAVPLPRRLGASRHRAEA